VTGDTFDEKMKVLYSYPTPIIQIREVHSISMNRQTKLLIWLESIGRQRIVLLSTDSEDHLLPTIRSRSVVFTEIPKYALKEEDEFKAVLFMQGLFSGKEKFESITTPDDAKKVAYHLRQLIVTDIQGRMARPAKKKLPGSDVELQTLMKVLERFLSDPATHNLKTLLMGFSMLPLQAMR
jgi:replication-associated recombination protein RarA